MGRELFKFVLVYAAAFLANLLTLWLMIIQAGMHAMVAQVIAMTVFVVTSYWLQASIVFKAVATK